MPARPSLACRKNAQPGSAWSGVIVFMITRSIWSIASPASATAARQASAARSEAATSGSACRRRRTPVRSTMNSSVVSIIFMTSKFVTTRGGT